jgi:hypothetical protein
VVTPYIECCYLIYNAAEILEYIYKGLPTSAYMVCMVYCRTTAPCGASLSGGR